MLFNYVMYIRHCVNVNTNAEANVNVYRITESSFSLTIREVLLCPVKYFSLDPCMYLLFTRCVHAHVFVLIISIIDITISVYARYYSKWADEIEFIKIYKN